MSNNHQYVSTQVAPYMVVAARRLPQVTLDSNELSFVMAEWDDLRAKLLEIDEEKHMFEEHYELLAGEKMTSGTKLHRSVDC